MWDIYNFLATEEKLYLPFWKKKSKRPRYITKRYLLDILTKAAFSIQKDQIKEPEEVTKQVSKGELVRFLQELTNKPLKFEEGREPNKEWLISVIYSLHPSHKIFEKSGSQMRRTLPQEFNFLNSLKINFRAIDKIMKLPSQQ